MFLFERSSLFKDSYQVNNAILKLPDYGFIVKHSENVKDTIRILINEYFKQIAKCKLLTVNNELITFNNFKSTFLIKRSQVNRVYKIRGWTIEKSTIMVWKTDSQSDMIKKAKDKQDSFLKQLQTTNGKQIIKKKDLHSLHEYFTM